jgi:hypothetical protein
MSVLIGVNALRVLGVFFLILYAGGRLPVTYIAAALGAWAGAAIGGRIGIDVLTIGDFPLIPATILAWWSP